MAISERC